MKNLEILCLRNNRIDSLCIFANAKLPNLRELDLSENELTGIDDLFSAQNDLSSLEILKIDKNRIRKFLTNFSAKFKEKTSVNMNMHNMNRLMKLRELSMEDNGLRELKRMSFLMPNLRNVNFRENRIGDLNDFLKEIRFLEKIEILEIEKNPISKKSYSKCQHLIVLECPSLKRMDGRNMEGYRELLVKELDFFRSAPDERNQLENKTSATTTAVVEGTDSEFDFFDKSGSELRDFGLYSTGRRMRMRQGTE